MRDSFKALLAGFEFAKATCRIKALQMHRLSASAFEPITLRNFEKKLYEANASVKRNTVNIIKQLMSSKLAMKMKDEVSRAACCYFKKCDTQTLEITRKSLLTLHHSELAWMEQSQAGINDHKLL